MLRSTVLILAIPFSSVPLPVILCSGAHILSGNVLEPRALDELLPDWRTQGAPVTTAAIDDRRGLPLTLALALLLLKTAALCLTSDAT